MTFVFEGDGGGKAASFVSRFFEAGRRTPKKS